MSGADSSNRLRLVYRRWVNPNRPHPVDADNWCQILDTVVTNQGRKFLVDDLTAVALNEVEQAVGEVRLARNGLGLMLSADV